MGKYAFVGKVASSAGVSDRVKNEFSVKFADYLKAYDKSRAKKHALDEKCAKHEALVSGLKKEDPSLADYENWLISETNSIAKKQRKAEGAAQALSRASASLLSLLERLGQEGQAKLLEQFRLNDIRKDAALPRVFWIGATATSVSIFIAIYHLAATGSFGEIGIGAMGVGLTFLATTAYALRKSSLAERAHNRLKELLPGSGST